MTRRLTPQQRLLREVTEAGWQHTVEQLAAWGGWRWYHPPDNRPVRARSGATYVQNVRRGFPDLILVKAGRAIAAELKTETGTVTADQAAWLDDLAAAGLEVAVWRPSDEPTVRAVLLDGAPIPTATD